MSQALGLLCFAIAWLVPNHYPPWSSFHSDSVAATGLILLVVCNWRLWRSAALPRIAWFIVAVACIPWLQYASGVLHYSGDALISSLYLLGLAVAIAAGAFLASSDAALFARHLSIAVVAGAALSSVLAILQAFDMGGLGIWIVDLPSDSRPFANLAQPNNLATLCGLGLAGLWLLVERRSIGRWAAGCILLLLLVGMSVSQSRTALLFAPSAALVLFVLQRRGVALKNGSGVLLLVGALQFALTWSWPQLQEALLLSPADAITTRGVTSARLKMWTMLVSALADRPWQGFGWLQVGAAELSVASRSSTIGELWLHGHNLFLELVIWCGYPLGLALCATVLYWFGSRVSKVKTLEAVAGMLSLGVLGVHSMLELPYHYAYFLFPAGLWIGVVEASLHATAPPRHLGNRVALNFVPIGAAAIMAGLIWTEYPHVEEEFRVARFESLRIRSQRSQGEPPIVHAPALSSLTGYMQLLRTPTTTGRTDADIAEMREAVRRYPHWGGMLRFAFTLALNGRQVEAHDLFLAIEKVHGADAYRLARRALRERISEGEEGLTGLAQSLPD